MALLDRLKDAGKTTNAIEPIQPEPGRADPFAATPPSSAAKKSDGKQPAYATEPEAIARSYYVEERGRERRYFDDYQRRALAIRADDAAISSKREDTNTIRAMLTLAETKGWTELKVNGTAAFKRETWIEAQARGIEARGYKASDLDRQEADRRRAERGPHQTPASNEIRADKAPARTASAMPSQAPARTEPDAQSRPPKAAGKTERESGPSPEMSAPPVKPTTAQRQAIYALAHEHLSPDGKLFMQAMTQKIDRQMDRLNDDSKIELKSFMANELLKKERREGPVQLTAEQRRIATTEPERTRPTPSPRTEPRREEPEPRRARGR